MQQTFVIFSSEREMLITTPDLKEAMIKEWFDGTGRNIDDYDVSTTGETAVKIQSKLTFI